LRRYKQAFTEITRSVSGQNHLFGCYTFGHFLATDEIQRIFKLHGIIFLHKRWTFEPNLLFEIDNDFSALR